MIFKYYVEVVKRCHPCHIVSQKVHVHPMLLFPIVTIGPFTKWGIFFTMFHPPSTRGHHYIIEAIDYFTMWEEAMPSFENDGETTSLSLFNQVITRFGSLRDVVTNHGNHFQNRMMSE